MPVPQTPGNAPQTPQDAQYTKDLAQLKSSKLYKELPLYPTYSWRGVQSRTRDQLEKDFRAASPEQRAALLAQLEYPSGRDLKQVARDSAATAIDSTGSTLGAYAGGLTLGGFGAVAGETAGSILANKANRALGLRDKPPSVNIPGLGQIPNDTLPGGFTTDDLAAGAWPLALRGAGVVAKVLSGPARQAMAAFKDQRDTLTKQFQTDMQEIAGNARLSNNQKQQAYAERTKRYQADVQDHTRLATELEAAGSEGFDNIGGHGPLYDQAKTLSKQVSPVDTSRFRQAAKELEVELNLPAEGLQNAKYKRIAEALSDFGAPRPATSTQSTLIDPATNTPFVTTTPGTSSDVPLDRLFATQRKLGQLIGKSSGEEKGIAKRLYAEIVDTIEAHAALDPTAAQAIGAQQEANLRFMREQALSEWHDLWQKATKPLSKTEVEINAQRLRDGLRKLETDDRFFSRAFSQEERNQFWQAVEQAPAKIDRSGLKTPTPDDPSPKLFERESQYLRDQAALPTEPTIPPINGKQAAKEGYLVGGAIGQVATGSWSPWAMIGGVANLAVKGLPWLASKAMLSKTSKKFGADWLVQQAGSDKYLVSPGMLAYGTGPGASEAPEALRPVTAPERQQLLQHPSYRQMGEGERKVLLEAFDQATPAQRAEFLAMPEWLTSSSQAPEEPSVPSPGRMVIDIEKDMEPDLDANREALFHDPAFRQYSEPVQDVITRRFYGASPEDQRDYLNGYSS